MPQPTPSFSRVFTEGRWNWITGAPATMRSASAIVVPDASAVESARAPGPMPSAISRAIAAVFPRGIRILRQPSWQGYSPLFHFFHNFFRNGATSTVIHMFQMPLEPLLHGGISGHSVLFGVFPCYSSGSLTPSLSGISLRASAVLILGQLCPITFRCLHQS